MKKILIALMLIIPLFANAQKDNNLAFKDSLNIYKDTSSEYHSKLDSLYSSFEEKYKNQQVTNIGGIPFGISREEALPILRNMLVWILILCIFFSNQTELIVILILAYLF